jgi:hypothetical protein
MWLSQLHPFYFIQAGSLLLSIGVNIIEYLTPVILSPESLANH